ncbi:hypothetical protein H4Q26_004548 [Puccinia striiformis f. sp. tritici PST-130]|nr:hypothetical protein H4Q26_004548 [Puccinia striiformis f. sp. tritici PST-130]
MIPCKHHGEEDELAELSIPLQDIGIDTRQAHSISTSVNSGSDHGNADDKTSNCGEEAKPATRTFPPTPHPNRVIKGITQSAPQRTNFDQTVEGMNINAEEESDSGTFCDACFLPQEWKETDNLNHKLEVFVKPTSYMEGNQSNGAHIIPKYVELEESLANKLQNCWEKTLSTQCITPCQNV